jgi:hypothetical protein
MTTAHPHVNSKTSFARRLRPVVLAATIVAAAFFATLQGSAPLGIDPELLEGRAPTVEELRPAVEAAFQAESYKPGDTATIAFFNNTRGVKLQMFHTGPEQITTIGNSEMQGVAVTAVTSIGSARTGRVVHIKIGNWPSGVYFVRLDAADGRVGFAPVVVTPRRLGMNRVAVVMPTLTWQAYNIRDDNGDGKGDSWYARWTVHTAHLFRPYLDRGVPYHFRNYDLPFLHWMAWTGHQADFLSDSDLDAVTSPKTLAHAYDLIIFPGHHEYITTHEYAIVRGYRDLGGNLAFLSANNFFWQTLRSGNTIERTSQWRDLDLPEASLIGTAYRANDDGQHRRPWIVRSVESAPWLFTGTGLVDGSTFGGGGIEIDKTSSASPSNVQVLAEIPDVLGPGLTAQMTYYETPAGAKVFGAGAFTLAGEVLSDPHVGQMITNLWTHLLQP